MFERFLSFFIKVLKNRKILKHIVFTVFFEGFATQTSTKMPSTYNLENDHPKNPPNIDFYILFWPVLVPKNSKKRAKNKHEKTMQKKWRPDLPKKPVLARNGKRDIF